MADPIACVPLSPACQLETGGMERLLVEFARHADRSRFALRFVALSKGGRIAGEIEACGWPVTVLDLGDGVRPTAVFRLASHLRGYAADVVHTHNTRPLLYAVPAARLAGGPAVVHTRHGQRHGASRRQNTLFRWACAGADCVVCVSEDAARRSRAEGIDAGKVRTITNGIDTTRFSGTRPEMRGPAVFVGQFVGGEGCGDAAPRRGHRRSAAAGVPAAHRGHGGVRTAPP